MIRPLRRIVTQIDPCYIIFKQSKSNEMLSGLRYFEHALKDNGRGQPKVAFSWGAVDMVSVARCFIQLCAKAFDVFSSEPRLLDFTSPCYVLGKCGTVIVQLRPLILMIFGVP